jgi:translation elongation factor P/translation initiation factor 5A
MIPCHDLRTGNIILVNNRLRKVTMISNSHTLTDQSLVGVESINYEENENYPVEDIQPVPMSEAVLQQCNFTYQQHFKFWQLISTDGGRMEMDIDPNYNLIDFMRRPMVKNIASLHQLQNIYYMLFNKEMDFDVETTVVVDGTVRGVVNKN